jgi:HK97 gp10 family phage protein
MPEFRKEMKRLKRQLNRKEVNRIKMRNARGMVRDMKQGAPSHNIAAMTGATTRQIKSPRAPKVGVRVGVINNNVVKFPKFSAPALASVLEYGTAERFRRLRALGVTVGAISTGKVKPKPWLRHAFDRNVKQYIKKTIKSMERRVKFNNK